MGHQKFGGLFLSSSRGGERSSLALRLASVCTRQHHKRTSLERKISAAQEQDQFGKYLPLAGTALKKLRAINSGASNDGSNDDGSRVIGVVVTVIVVTVIVGTVIVTIVMMVIPMMIVAVPSCGWSRATDCDCADNAQRRGDLP